MKDLLENIKELTKVNAHNDSRIEIAEYFKLTAFAKKFKLIREFHLIEGQMRTELINLRNALTIEMLLYLVKTEAVTKEEHNEIYLSL